MTDVLRTARSSTRTEGRVGEYETIHGAELAARHLDDAGFDADDIRIVAAATHPLPGWRARVTRQTHPVIAVCAAGAVGALLLAVLVMNDWTIATALFTAVVVGVALGVLASWIDAAWATRVRRRAQAEQRIVADRFEVRVARNTESARRTLARWWNPEAPPASWSPAHPSRSD